MADHGFEEEDFSEAINLRMWKGVARFALGYKRELIPLAVVALVCAACDASFNLIVRKVIDSADAGRRDVLLNYGLAFAGVIVVLSVCIWLFIYLAGKCSTGISHDIRREAFARLQSLEFAYFDERPVGWLMARLTTDCQRLSRILSWGVLDVVWGVTLTLSIAVILFILNWKLALVVFSVLPPLAWISVHFQRAILKSSRQARKVNSQITAAYNESIMAVRTTKSLVREQQNLHEFQDQSVEMFNASVKNALQSAMYWPLVTLIGSVGTGLALWFGGVRAMHDAISLGTMIAFIGYAGQFFDPIHMLAMRLTELQGAQAAAERIVSLLETEPKIKDSPEVAAAIQRQTTRLGDTETWSNCNNRDNNSDDNVSITAETQRAQRTAIVNNHASGAAVALDGLEDRIETIEFRDVSFAYKANQAVLENFSLTIRAGQSVARLGLPAVGRRRSWPCFAGSMSLRLGRSLSMASTIANGVCTGCSRIWGSCCNSRTCSVVPCRRISATADLRLPMMRWSGRLSSSMPSRLSWVWTRAMRAKWGRAAIGSASGRSS